jgi:hypothetical protein
MTRTLTLSVIALLGLSALAHAQTKGSSSGACGPETWSTDKMTYVGVPCADNATPQQASAPSTDVEYCGALVARYDTFLNKGGKSGGMRSTDNAANVAAARCRAGDPSGIADLERALKDAQVALPPRS